MGCQHSFKSYSFWLPISIVFILDWGSASWSGSSREKRSLSLLWCDALWLGLVLHHMTTFRSTERLHSTGPSLPECLSMPTVCTLTQVELKWTQNRQKKKKKQWSDTEAYTVVSCCFDWLDRCVTFEKVWDFSDKVPFHHQFLLPFFLEINLLLIFYFS